MACWRDYLELLFCLVLFPFLLAKALWDCRQEDRKREGALVDPYVGRRWPKGWEDEEIFH